MKKFIALIMFMCALFVSQAQYTETLNSGSYGVSYKGLAKDTVSATDTAFTYDITVNKATSLYYNLAVKVARVSAGSCTVSIMGKIYETDVFTPITSGTFAGSQADTTIIFTQNTTKQFYRIYRVKVVYVSGKTKVTSFVNYLFY